MPIPETIRKEIVRLSLANKHGEIVKYLKPKLMEGNVLVEDLLAYARDYRFTKKYGKPYVVNAETIKKLGVVVSKLEGKLKDKSALKIAFYKLAAERNCNWGHRNLAQCYFNGDVVKKDFDLALKHMGKAIELKHKDYLLYGRILMAKEKFAEAIEAFEKVDDKKEKDSATQRISACCFRLGQQYYKDEKYKEAAKLFNKIDKESKHWESAREIMVAIFKRQLESLYKKVEAIKDPKEPKPASDKITGSGVKLQVPQGWFRISKFLEGFEAKSCEELKLKLQYFELKSEMLGSKIKYLRRLKKLEKDQDTDKFKQISARLEKAENKQKALNQKIEDFSKSYREYADIPLQVRTRQFKVESKFFNPERINSKKTLSIAQELVTRRVSSSVTETPLDVTSNPMRRLIAAERSTIDASERLLKMEANYRSYVESGIGWVVHRSETHGGYYSTYQQKYSFDERIKIGSSALIYQQKVNCHENHLGDFYMKGLGSYSSIYQQLKKITYDSDKGQRQDNEKKLAECMLAFCKNGKPIDLAVLKEINSNKDDFSENDVTEINRIFYHCFVKEIASWMLPREESHKLPLAIIQARALKLIIAGHLKLKEVFSSNAPYGIFTGSNIGSHDGQHELRGKIDRINALYQKAMLEHSDGYVKFFKTKPQGQVTATCENLHQELLDTFGGQDDSDGEEYESDGERVKSYQDMLDM